MAKQKPIVFGDFILDSSGRYAIAKSAIVMLAVERMASGKWELQMRITSESGRPGQLDSHPIREYETDTEAVAALREATGGG